jgi:hypothetical protein
MGVGPVDELLDVAVEHPALDQLEVEVGCGSGLRPRGEAAHAPPYDWRRSAFGTIALAEAAESAAGSQEER